MPVNNHLAVFSYIGQDVRTVQADEQPWFVVRDIAAVLGIQNARQVVGGFDADDVSAIYIEDSLGRPQTTSVVSEAGLYELVFQSRKPEAKQFRKWITHEVLPAIRRTGSYTPTETPEQTIARALILASDQLESVKAELAAAAPRAEAWDALASAEGDFSVADAAKVLARDGINTGPQRLFAQLADIKWVFRGADREWRAYAERVEKGYLAEKLSYRYHPGTGERIVNTPQVRVTVKGIERLRQRLHVGALQAVSA